MTDPYQDAISNAANELEKTVDRFEIWVSEQEREYDILFGNRCWCGGFAPCAMHREANDAP